MAPTEGNHRSTSHVRNLLTNYRREALVGPLYDNIPSIGIRELTQNAVDAVRERWALQDKYPDLREVPLITQESDVEIWLDDPDKQGNAWLTISDCGAGMSVEIVRAYFLTAGASFRNSDEWKREFETTDGPRSRVLRSGRFGVGMLAGFLLGPKMEISTRYIRDEVGIRFDASLDPKALELRYDSRLNVGTTIRILVPPVVRQKLIGSGSRVSLPEKWSWYIYDSPSISRFIGAERKLLASPYVVRRPDPALPSELRRMRSSYQYSVYWTYRDLPNLVVNRIHITDSASRRKWTYGQEVSDTGKIWHEDASCYVTHPKVVIDDPDGAFPLNLRRSDITETNYPFQSTLVTDIIDDFLAYLLVNCPTNGQKRRWPTHQSHPGIQVHHAITTGLFNMRFHPFVMNAQGITLYSSRLLAAIESPAVHIHFTREYGNPVAGCTNCLGVDAFIFDPRIARRSGDSVENWSPSVLGDDILYLAALENAQLYLKQTAANTEGRGSRSILTGHRHGVSVLGRG